MSNNNRGASQSPTASRKGQNRSRSHSRRAARRLGSAESGTTAQRPTASPAQDDLEASGSPGAVTSRWDEGRPSSFAYSEAPRTSPGPPGCGAPRGARPSRDLPLPAEAAPPVSSRAAVQAGGRTTRPRPSSHLSRLTVPPGRVVAPDSDTTTWRSEPDRPQASPDAARTCLACRSAYAAPTAVTTSPAAPHRPTSTPKDTPDSALCKPVSLQPNRAGTPPAHSGSVGNQMQPAGLLVG